MIMMMTLLFMSLLAVENCRTCTNFGGILRTEISAKVVQYEKAFSNIMNCQKGFLS